MSVLATSYVYWCVALVLLVPLAIVLLNEGIDRTRRNGGQFTDLLLMLRDVLLPLLVLVILLRFVFNVDAQNLPTKVISTLFWGALMIAVFRLTLRLIGSGSYSAEDWRNMVPHMFLRLPPYTIMGLIVFHVVQNLWSLPIREMATTLGIGSIVVAFALQDTLSNLVSGILLVANSPFKPGDWVQVGDVEGKITAVNWRYTNIENWNGDLVVIPNGSIAGESIENHNRPHKTALVSETFTFSYQHSPNTIKDMFDEVFSNTPGILAEPAPSIVVTKIDDPAMHYSADFWISDYGEKYDVHAEFMSRVWYALQRHRIELPTPLYNLHTYSGQRVVNAAQEATMDALKNRLDWVPHFSRLPQTVRERLATGAHLKLYAEEEVIVNQSETETGVSVVLSGVVHLSYGTTSQAGKTLQTLHPGEFFGEAGLFGKAVSPVKAIAGTSAEILCIPHDLINDVINRNPGFAHEFSLVVEQRRARLELTSATGESPDNTMKSEPQAEMAQS